MATQQTVQQVMEFLKTHPDVAKRAADFIKSHPEDARAAFKDIAEERGWDLSKIDPSALKDAVSKITH